MRFRSRHSLRSRGFVGVIRSINYLRGHRPDEVEVIEAFPV